MIRVHTDMDIAVEEPEIHSVSRNLIEEESDRIPGCHTSNAGQHTHTAVSESSVSSQVVESMGPNTENSQGSTSSAQVSGDNQKEVGLSNPGPGLDPANDATQQELNEIERRRIVEGCCLNSSDDDEVNKVAQPAANPPEDSWKIKLSEE